MYVCYIKECVTDRTVAFLETDLGCELVSLEKYKRYFIKLVFPTAHSALGERLRRFPGNEERGQVRVEPLLWMQKNIHIQSLWVNLLLYVNMNEDI